MITESDSFTTFDIGDYYIILPNNNKKIFNGPELVVPAGVLAPTAKAEFIEGGIFGSKK